ncbi:hypothetical protein BP951000_1843 [Brachyspira pilosicoli 95/1000]|uniref:Uncharacterized protein n=1 Tax=Brachyspira pilosicoli (strain ATCC BAA-1826 / 95/1000) TaxID=759914 RepID=D8IF99_BRAP9|nr:hypothetical protein BP951000_1843 [Brachyspira pilosicoli 95/1000]
MVNDMAICSILYINRDNFTFCIDNETIIFIVSESVKIKHNIERNNAIN